MEKIINKMIFKNLVQSLQVNERMSFEEFRFTNSDIHDGEYLLFINIFHRIQILL